MKTVEQFGLFAGYGRRMVIVQVASKSKVTVETVRGVASEACLGERWTEWHRSIVISPDKYAPEGIEPRLIGVAEAACYV